MKYYNQTDNNIFRLNKANQIKIKRLSKNKFKNKKTLFKIKYKTQI